MSSEIKVGVVFFLGLVILFVMTVVVTGFSFFDKGYTFPVYFSNIGGLEEGSRVLFSGVNVGTVDEVTIRENLVRVLLRIEDNNVVIPEDSEVNIEQSNLLAGMQVSIMAGQSKQPITGAKKKMGTDPAGFTQALSDAATSAKKAIDDIREPLTETIENIENITKEIKEGDGTAHKLIYEEEIYENVRVASEKLSNILTELDEGKGTIGQLLKDDTVYEKLKSTLDEAEKAVAGIKEIVEGAQKGEGTLGKFIKDDEVYENVRKITRDVKEGLEGEGILAKLFSNESAGLYTDIEDTAAGAKELIERLNSGQGTLGKLFTSEDVYDDIKAITGNLRLTSEKLQTKDNTMGKLFNESTLYDKAEETIDNLDQTLGAAARMKVFVHLNFFTSNHPYQVYRSQVQIKLWPHDKRYFLLGATFTDVGEAAPLIDMDPDYESKGKYFTNVDFQLAWVFDLGPSPVKEDKENIDDSYKLTMRVGLVDGLTGGGFDLDFWKHFRITCEARATHRNEGDFYEHVLPYYARAYLSMRVYHYFRVYAGVDNFADHAVASFGVSIEWEDKDIKNIVGIAGSAF